MLTDKDYENWAHTLGKKFRISGRVIRHIRNAYKNKYSEMEFGQFRNQIRAEANDQIKLVKRSTMPLIIDVIGRLSQEIQGLEQSNRIKESIESSLPHALGGIDKLGFRESIKCFAGRMTRDQFMEIIADIPDPITEGGEVDA